LNQGIIQQIGAPMDLYNKPQNKFVASFIGSPAMNFLNGQLHISGQQKIFEFGSLKLDFSNAPTPETSGPYTLGLRPEALKVKTTADGRESEGPTDFELKLLLLEPHGNEAHVIGSLEDQQLILRSANPNRLKVIYQAKKDDFLPITVDREALHWFAADENGKRLV
jgi:ABC-type sugar transport system ATPase subunit